MSATSLGVAPFGECLRGGVGDWSGTVLAAAVGPIIAARLV